MTRLLLHRNECSKARKETTSAQPSITVPQPRLEPSNQFILKTEQCSNKIICLYWQCEEQNDFHWQSESQLRWILASVDAPHSHLPLAACWFYSDSQPAATRSHFTRLAAGAGASGLAVTRTRLRQDQWRAARLWPNETGVWGRDNRQGAR